MKPQSWAIIAFMAFGAFVGADMASTSKAGSNHLPEIMPIQVLQPMGATHTAVNVNLNTGEATVYGPGDVSVTWENPEKIISSVETRTEYVTKVEYVDDIIKSTKLINKLMPIEKPVLGLEKINPVRD